MMKMTKFHKSLIGFLTCSSLSIGVANAIQIDIYDPITQSAEIDSILANSTILENFESYTTGTYPNLDTNIGTFTAVTAGNGSTSAGTNFKIADYNIAGRDLQSNFLDSADLTKLTLDVELDSYVRDLFFYVMDAGDISANTTIYAESGTSYDSDSIAYNRINGNWKFVNITLGVGETLETLTWNVNKTNDGYGLDNFGTTSSPEVPEVPEPSTMLLFGIGLVSAASVSRRKQ